MAVFNRYVIKDFTKERYLELVRDHPRLGEEKTQIYLMLILTFLSLSFLGLFAINPTLMTIVELDRKMTDSKFVNNALTTKTSNLSSLNTQYNALDNSWPVVNSAVPGDPDIITLTGQIKSIAFDTKVTITNLQYMDFILSNPLLKKPIIPKESAYQFTVSVEGTKDNLIQFVRQLTNFDRVLSIDSVMYTSEEKENITIHARAFFTL